VFGNIPNRRRVAGMPANREEQLVLGRSDAGIQGLLFAPVQKASQLVPEGQETLVVGV
jgi:hypothetical protein